jgi:hypothetical protein
MKRRTLLPHVILASVAAISVSFAQEERRPEPALAPGAEPPEQRPPLPPQELRDRPRDVERPPGDRPDRPMPRDRRDPARPGEEGRPSFGDRRPDGPRGFGEGRRGERYREFRREPEERERKPTPYLGVVSVPLPPVLSAQLGLEDGFGLVVENVLPESPAQAAGVQRYDVLKLLNDQQLMSPDQLSRLVQRMGKDAEATLTVVRKGQEQKLTIKVGEKLLPARGDRDGVGSRGFGGMGGFVRPADREQIEEIRRRTQEMGRRDERDPMRGIQDRVKAMQEKVRSYQDAMRRYQEQMREWQKNPASEPPQMPAFPEIPAEPKGPDGSGRPGQPGVRPADLLRELRPGDGPGVRAEWSDGSSRWDATRARMVMRDSDGELEVNIKDGKRMLTIKNLQGEVVFNGPVDSPEQRSAIPEQYRGKLAAMAPPPPPPSDVPSGEPPRPRREPPVPLIEREPDVQ